MRGALGLIVARVLMTITSSSACAEEIDVTAAPASRTAAAGIAPEALTAEQKARLPQARAAVDAAFPSGSQLPYFFPRPTMRESQARSEELLDARRHVRIALRLSFNALPISQEDAEEVATLLDPAWRDRVRREIEAIPRHLAILDLMQREALAEEYAANFSADELADLTAFFATDTGSHLARVAVPEGWRHRVRSETVAEAFRALEAQLEEANADLPPERQFGDLSALEQARLSSLLGLSGPEIEGRLNGTDPPPPAPPRRLPVVGTD